MTLNLTKTSVVTFEKFFLPISMKFGMQVEVDEWCTMVCRMAGSKVNGSWQV